MTLRCLSLLEEGWHDKATLAARLGVGERAVKRYLAAIAGEVIGYEFRVVDERGKREYRVRRPGLLGSGEGSPYELLALAVAERTFRAFDPGGVADLIDGLLYGLSGIEDDEGARDVLGRSFVLARPPQPLPGSVRRVFDDVLRGLVERRVLELRYRPRLAEARDYVVRPYTLVLAERELAIVGAVGDREGAVRTFALHRIEGIRCRKERFERPNQKVWDPQRTYAAAWGLYTGPAERVLLAVHPAYGELLSRRRWHASQRLEGEGDDGWIELSFEVFTGAEFRTWLLGWGPWLRVREPDHLRAWHERSGRAAPDDAEPDPQDLYRIV